ncbi:MULTISPECIES: Flp pilus assembly protein CpaB [unclassified Psychrobacillus]|uniref:Flp pilus assembly protein CpaB n=1 Tax=unclassified Psychrobacillus TaxID=2636677 RepID=UPI0030FCACDC
MKMKRMAILFIQVALIGGAIFFFMNYTQKEIEPTKVYVYTADMEANQEIKEADITQIEIPAKGVQDNFVTDKKDLKGMFIGSPVFKGQYVYKDNVIKEGEQDPFDSMDLERYRKMSIPVSLESGIGGNLERGDKIDLIYQDGGKAKVEGDLAMEESDFIYSKAFLQDVIVYNVVTKEGIPYVDRSESGYTSEDEDGVGGELAVLTVAVTLDQAEEISARQAKGSISMVARFSEAETYETLGFVLGDYEKQFVAPVEVETNRPQGE